MLRFHDRTQPGHDFRMLGGDVRLFARIGREIVKFDGVGFAVFGFRRRMQVAAERFPIADAHALLPAIARRLAVEKRPRLLLLAKQCGSEADAVQVARRFFLGAN